MKILQFVKLNRVFMLDFGAQLVKVKSIIVKAPRVMAMTV